jgi:hypothetical protein
MPAALLTQEGSFDHVSSFRIAGERITGGCYYFLREIDGDCLGSPALLCALLFPQTGIACFPFLPLPLGTSSRGAAYAYGNQRPPIGVVLRDVWQLGDWLRTFPG